MLGRRTMVAALSVLVALGTIVFAQDEKDSRPYPELYAEYQKAAADHGVVLLDKSTNEASLATIEKEVLAPLRAKQAKLLAEKDAKLRPVGDPELAAVTREIMAAVESHRVVEKQRKHTELVRKELDLRQKTINTGWKALRKMLDRAETILDLAQVQNGGRNNQVQVDDIHKKCISIMEHLDLLEKAPLSVVAEFKPPEIDESDEKQVAGWVASLGEELLEVNAIALELKQRVERKEREQAHLLKLKKLGVNLGRGNMLDGVTAKLEEFQKVHERADARASAINKELARLSALPKKSSSTGGATGKAP